MSTKVKFILYLFAFCLSIILIVVTQNEKKELEELKKQKQEAEKIAEESEDKEDAKEDEIIEEEIVEEEIVEEPQLKSLGKFKLTAYCPCDKCCGKWAGGNTASGTKPIANRTIAVDTSVIPFGTEVIINGHTYVAEDTGSAIIGNKIDIYMDSHKTALEFGVQYAEVFVKE